VKRAGLFVVPRQGKQKAHRKVSRLGGAKPLPPSWVGMVPNEAMIDYMYRDPAGAVKHRSRKWSRPQTVEAIAKWMTDYFDRVASGYIPDGFEVAPIPFCARVTIGARVVAEWSREPQGLLTSVI
jgi:hypothetical protein